MDENLDVTNAEIIEYLNITYDVLKSTKSTLDLNRLKTIIDILKNEEKKIYQTKTKRTSIQNENIINILDKLKNGIELSKDEIKVYDDFVESNPFIDLIQKKNYSELYKLLNSKESEFKVGELCVLYFCLYKERTRQKKRGDILKGIYTFIEQNIYFDNMDLKYKKNVNEDKNI